MGKKRRMIARPQKYGKKYARHPALKREVVKVPILVEPKAPPAPIVVEVEEEIKVEVKKPPTKKATPKKRKSYWSKKKTTDEKD